VTAISSAPSITQQGSEWIFRTQITAAKSASTLTKYFNDQGYKIAMINDTNEFGTNWCNVVESTLEDVGNPALARVTFVTGDRDFTSQLLNIQQSDATALIICGQYEEAGLILQQMRDFGMDLPTGGPDASANPRIFELVPPEILEGYIFANSYIRELPDPRVEAYVSTYEEKFGISSANSDAVPYDTVYIIASAVERAGSTTPDAIRDALTATSYEGLSGLITFDENGDAQRGAYIIMMHADQTYSILQAPN
jgi:branched-chain amino acid transport system substrate-binding protein